MVIQLSNAGGRLIIASDGIWDALSSEMAAKSCRGLPAELAAKLVVKVGSSFQQHILPAEAFEAYSLCQAKRVMAFFTCSSVFMS